MLASLSLRVFRPLSRHALNGWQIIIAPTPIRAAICQQLLAFPRQQQAATDTVKKPYAKFLLKVSDLSG